MKHLLVGMFLLLGAAVSATAAPLEANKVSEDAKWVLHFDFDEFRNTHLAKTIREERLEQPNVQAIMNWIEERYGIDVQEDLHALTMYGHGYQPEQGVAILSADYDRENLTRLVQENPGHRTEQYRDYTVHTWTPSPVVPELAGRATTMSAAFRNGTAVFSQNADNVKKTLDVLDGERPHLGEDSFLVHEIPEGTVLYGAGTDLEGLGETENPMLFGTVAVLKQAERACFALGHKDDQAFYLARFKAREEEAADQLVKVLEGYKAMIELQAAEDERLGRIAEGMKWEREENTIMLNWTADSEDVVSFLQSRVKEVERAANGGGAQARPQEAPEREAVPAR